MFDIIKKIFGTPHERAVRRMKPMVKKINKLEPAMEKLSDDDLKDAAITISHLDDPTPERMAATMRTARPLPSRTEVP